MKQFKTNIIKILCLSLLISAVLSAYSHTSSFSFTGYTLTSFALAPKPVSNNGANNDLAIGFASGFVRLTSISGNIGSFIETKALNGPAVFVDWHYGGVCAASTN